MPTENSIDSGYDSPASDAASGMKENSNVESPSTLTPSASTSTPAGSKGPLPPLPPSAGSKGPLPPLPLSAGSKGPLPPLPSSAGSKGPLLPPPPPPLSSAVSKEPLPSSAESKGPLPVQANSVPEELNEQKKQEIPLSKERVENLKKILNDNSEIWKALKENKEYFKFKNPGQFLKKLSKKKIEDIVSLINERLTEYNIALNPSPEIAERLEDEGDQIRLDLEFNIRKYEEIKTFLEIVEKEANAHLGSLKKRARFKKVSHDNLDLSAKLNMIEIDIKDMAIFQEVNKNNFKYKFVFWKYKSQSDKILLHIDDIDIKNVISEVDVFLRKIRDNCAYLERLPNLLSKKHEKIDKLLIEYKIDEEKLINFKGYLQNLQKKEKQRISKDNIIKFTTNSFTTTESVGAPQNSMNKIDPQGSAQREVEKLEEEGNAAQSKSPVAPKAKKLNQLHEDVVQALCQRLKKSADSATKDKVESTDKMGAQESTQQEVAKPEEEGNATQSKPLAATTKLPFSVAESEKGACPRGSVKNRLQFFEGKKSNSTNSGVQGQNQVFPQYLGNG